MTLVMMGLTNFMTMMFKIYHITSYILTWGPLDLCTCDDDDNDDNDDADDENC